MKSAYMYQVFFNWLYRLRVQYFVEKTFSIDTHIASCKKLLFVYKYMYIQLAGNAVVM